MNDTVATLPTVESFAGNLPKVFIPPFQVGITPCTHQDLLSFIQAARQQQQKVLIDNVNMDILFYAQHHEEYRHVLNTLSAINLVDGQPIRWLAALAGIRVPQRLALTDVVPMVMQLAAEKDYRVFIVGSNPETLALAKKNLREQGALPSHMTCWSYPRRQLEDPRMNQALLEQIDGVQPALLFIALGSPWQTMWISRNWHQLPDCVILPVGGAFDFLAGTVPRAPKWMQQIGLEWFFRLVMDRQPRERSLFHRYVLTDIPFALQLAIRIQREKGRLSIRTQETG